jgi:hypothetical protein
VPADKEMVVRIHSNLWEGQSLQEICFKETLSARELITLLFKQYSLKLKKTDMFRGSTETEKTETKDNDLSPRSQEPIEGSAFVSSLLFKSNVAGT